MSLSSLKTRTMSDLFLDLVPKAGPPQRNTNISNVAYRSTHHPSSTCMDPFNRLPRPLVSLNQGGVLAGHQRKGGQCSQGTDSLAPSLQGGLGLAVSLSLRTQLQTPSFLSMTPSNPRPMSGTSSCSSLLTWGKEPCY